MAEIRQNLLSLTIAALDELDRFRALQEVINVSLDQLDTTDRTQQRVETLLNCYLADAELRFDELHTHLSNIRKLIAPPPPPIPQPPVSG